MIFLDIPGFDSPGNATVNLKVQRRSRSLTKCITMTLCKSNRTPKYLGNLHDLNLRHSQT